MASALGLVMLPRGHSPSCASATGVSTALAALLVLVDGGDAELSPSVKYWGSMAFPSILLSHLSASLTHCPPALPCSSCLLWELPLDKAGAKP